MYLRESWNTHKKPSFMESNYFSICVSVDYIKYLLYMII